MGYSDVRVPNASIIVNDSAVSGLIDVEITSTSFLGADRYRLCVALNASGYEVWSADEINVQIAIGLDGSWQTLIQGPVDRVDVDLGNGLVHVDGRDFTARFIEARTRETFENQTASDVAALLAARRGLAANVTPTTTLVGRNFGGDYSRTTLDQHSNVTTEWDLLVKLASLEGFDVWVDGQTLNFTMPALDSSPLIMTPADCKSVRLDRAMTLSGGLEVTVKSWDCRAQSAVSQVVTSATSGASARSYVVLKPNLTEIAANNLAQRILSEMSQSSRVVTFEMPGDVISRPRQTLILANTNTDFDGSYVITSIERRLSVDHGFTETLQARIPPWTTF